MRDNKILDRRNIPFQSYMERDYFVVVEKPITLSNGCSVLKYNVSLTTKGEDWLINKLGSISV